MYDRRAPGLFKQYGGGNWPAVLLPEGFNSADLFGGFGYGVVVVDEDGIVRSINDYSVESAVNEMFLAGTREAKNAEEAAAVGGYWHNGKCWRFYQDTSISVEEAAGVVDERLKQFNDSKVTIGGQQWNVESFQRANNYLTVTFNGGEKIKLKSSKLSSGKSPLSVLIDGYFKTKSDSGDLEITYSSKGRGKIKFEGDGTILATGKLRPKTGKGEKRPFEIQLHESILSLGNSKLEIKDSEAILSGKLGGRTYRQIKNMIVDHPEVRTITLAGIEGCVDDDINMHTGRLIREAGLTTKITKGNEVIHSGGIDLFCAGAKRIIEPSAELKIRPRFNESNLGVTFPKDHPAHQYQLAYFEEMLGENSGSEFYFFTLEFPPAKYVPTVTVEQIKKWNLAKE